MGPAQQISTGSCRKFLFSCSPYDIPSNHTNIQRDSNYIMKGRNIPGFLICMGTVMTAAQDTAVSATASQPLSSDHAGSCHDSWRCMRRGCWRRRESKETRLFSQKPCCKTSFPNSGPASFTPDAPPVLRPQEPNRYFRSRKQWILANLVRKNVVCCHLVKTKYTPSL